ncbi:MAG: AAA domain-containing protein, partial [Pirellulaceae bacterium]
EDSGRLEQELGMLQQLESQWQTAVQANSAWKDKLAERDVQPAIDAANALSRKWAPIFFPSWWRLRKVMKRSYDFASHPVKPTWVSVLTALRDEYTAVAAVDKQRQQIAQEYGLSGDVNRQLDLIEETRRVSQEFPEWLTEIHGILVTSEQGTQLVQQIAELDPDFRKLRSTLDEFLEIWETMALPELQCELATIADSLDLLPDYLSCLEQLSHVPEEVRVALQRMDLPPEQIAIASAAHSLELIAREEREVANFDQPARARHVTRLENAHNAWMDVNAKHVRQQTQARFLDHIRQTSLPPSELGPEQSRFKQSWDAGRRVLEHEFGKQMRYKSIRDLVSGDSGVVVRDLKPVWLMSPLSVSDTLPLGEQDFDVVIFDEASQITLETAIPSLFRANQTIVVGDEQQLPPTDFFSARADEDEGGIEFEHQGEMVTYDLESNSLLNHAARNLPSTMLGWHYRSRDEALISFSNWAFYSGRLLTIPEEKLLSDQLPPLQAEDADAAARNVQSMFQRPISFHFMQNGLYLRRRNTPESDYIAHLIRELLKEGSGRTIGVIAFSEAQQSEIEDAISRLARQDEEFSALVEAEMTREDDGQFVGLLVKNLENIQGDERDIILLSICYGPDDNDRMIMNFGPINKSGGEKRLNVAFSRAKHHMAVISSIKYSRITNEYNVGANCLRNYLRYAEAISGGDVTTATTVLRSLAPWIDIQKQEQKPVSPFLQQIADRLAAHELQVDFDIGHSDFRCDLGVRKAGDTQYRLGILVDHGDYYSSDVELIDRELFRPRLLKIFGWNTYAMLATDWLKDPERIIEEIRELCEQIAQD